MQNNSNLKSALIFLALDILIIALLLLIGDAFQKPFADIEYSIQGLKQAENAEVVFIGNSHSLTGLDMPTFTEITEKDAYNCSTAAQSPTSAEVSAFLALQNPNTKTLYIEVFSMLFPEEDHVTRQIQYVSYIDDSAYKLNLWYRNDGISGVVSGYIPLFDNHLVWRNSEERGIYLFDKKYVEQFKPEYDALLISGSIRNNTVMSESTYASYDNYTYTFDYQTRMNEQTQHWDAIIEMCKKKNVKVVFFMMPWVDKFIENTNYDEVTQAFSDYFDEHGVPYLDLNQMDVPFVFTDFIEEPVDANQHLNTTGMIPATVFLAEWDLAN